MPSPLPPAPKVSVVVVTHNHEAYLAQALDSILMQEVTFSYELIVGEDGSTDQTRRILEAYHQRYPALIRPIYQSGTVGPGANAQACLAACRGQYLAPLEGDDYWTNPHKLQAQVDWLDAHPDYVFCFDHLDKLTDMPGQAAVRTPMPIEDEERTVFYFADFFRRSVPHIGTVVLRNVIPRLPDWLFTVYPIDTPLLILYAEHGKTKRLPGVNSVYREHAGGSWSQSAYQWRARKYADMFSNMQKHYLGTRHEAFVTRAYGKMYLTLSYESISHGDLALAHHYLGQFWQANIGYAIRASLLKSLLGVSSRLAVSHGRKFLAHTLNSLSAR